MKHAVSFHQFQRPLTAVLVGCLFCSANALANPTDSVIHQSAPANGWAAMNGGTNGGAKATQQHIYHISTEKALRSALKSAGDQPKILLIETHIDLSGGVPFNSFVDQKKRSQIRIPANTTIIGMNAQAGFSNGSLIIKKTQNVIVRNITIETPVDVAPHFEKGDGWNAEWDGMNIDQAQHVWIDHVTITDGHFTDSMYHEKDGWEYVQHDGDLDIKRGSDFVTVSHSLFENHNKCMLIGHSDHNAKQDQGKLHVTLTDNVFKNIVQRTPRVRFGHVHVYNNLFQSNEEGEAKGYTYKYSLGLGYESNILSENNDFDIASIKSPCHIYKNLSHGHGGELMDHGSVFNGKALNLKDCDVTSTHPQTIPYQYQLKAANTLAKLVNTAGAGKL